jgi:amino-acid N-acetyltransferase
MANEERTPPAKIRVTGLQEAQLVDLRRIDEQVAARHYEVGITPEQLSPRSDVTLAQLPRQNDVMVAEADHDVAGFLVWADQAPGVAYLSTLAVGADFQRFGVATRLLRELGEKTQQHGIEYVATQCWERASWALSFLAVRGFSPLEPSGLPDKVARWHEQHPAEPGQTLWWRKTEDLGLIPGLPKPA